MPYRATTTAVYVVGLLWASLLIAGPPYHHGAWAAPIGAVFGYAHDVDVSSPSLGFARPRQVRDLEGANQQGVFAGGAAQGSVWA